MGEKRKIDKSTKVQLRSELMHMDTVFIFPTLSKYVPSLSLSLSRWFINYFFYFIKLVILTKDRHRERKTLISTFRRSFFLYFAPNPI
jgi:hypothetical protein